MLPYFDSIVSGFRSGVVDAVLGVAASPRLQLKEEGRILQLDEIIHLLEAGLH